MKLRILELFAGIGACSTALKRLGIDLEIVDAVEIDKYAMASFNAIHNTNFEPQDITIWNKELKDIDLITHGSPCQDFSVAGKQAGGDIGSGTRSSLMYETIRIVGQVRPKYVLWENVKNLLSKKHKHNFDAYIETMNILGYNSYYQVLNAKDYGIPQNRERVYTISIRKDIDKGNFAFPEKEELKLRLKDMLEDEVDEKYYLSDKIMQGFINHNKKHEEKGTGFIWKPKSENDIASTIRANAALCPTDNTIKCKQVGNLYGGKWDKINESCTRVYSEEGISPTVHTCQGGNTEPKIMTHIIPQTVKVRKYPVNIPLLQKYLKNRKHNIGITNKEIAEKLNVPKTKVEHWFRQDKSFAIPDPEIWFQLKEILYFNLDIFDESVMTFEERKGVFEKADRVYDKEGLSPTLTQQEEKILIKNATKKGYDEAIDGDAINLSYPDSKTRRGRVGHQVSQTIQCNDSMGVVQNSIKVIGNYMPSNHDASRIVDNEGLAPTIKENHGTVTATNYGLRIRKLTPKECWRLMGFDDIDFEKTQNISTSNSQLYKQAGNSIVVDVLIRIFRNLLEVN